MTAFFSHFVVNNILEGLIWFWVPAFLVIANDVFAYIFGITFGRTPLIKLSPKKTVEGFVGAFWSTLLFGVLWGTWFMRFNYMICPVHDLGVNAWSLMQCTPNPVFVWREWALWPPLTLFLTKMVCRYVDLSVKIPNFPFPVRLDDYDNPICTISIPPSFHVNFCFLGSSVWRILRFWL
jgi:phosphatidate cytidylyltransferase